MTAPVTPVSYDIKGAAAALGVSPDLIRLAIRAGDLEAHFLMVNGRAIDKPLILAADLLALVKRSPTERAA